MNKLTRVKIDLHTTPFSRYGSYMSISYLLELKDENAGSFLDIARPAVYKPRPAGLYLQTVHGDALRQEIFRFELIYEGESLPFQVEANPFEIKLISTVGFVRLCFSEPEILFFSAENVGLRIVGMPGVFDQVIPRGLDKWEYNSLSTRQRFMVSRLEGSLSVDAPYNHLEKKSDHIILDFLPNDESRQAKGVFEDYNTSWIPRKYNHDYESSLSIIVDDFNGFLEKTVPTSQELEETLIKAAYVNWSCVVKPNGILPRAGMLMSKGMMANIWSWDHTFNAMALAYQNPKLAWDQFMIPFDLMDDEGCLPDSVSDLVILRNFTKPPIHGMMLRRMDSASNLLTYDRMKEIFEPLERWTEWWFTFRDDDKDGLPQYNHGNDSGWDNGTIFDCIHPVSSPDLAAFLVIQMEVLADIAKKIGEVDKSIYWNQRSKQLLSKLQKKYCINGFFVALGAHGKVMDTMSLQLLLPLILGKRLPANIIKNMVFRIKNDGFLTDYGIATESVLSPEYQPNGYWRGPIWAPSTLIIVDALVSVGEHELAKAIAVKFCNLCRNEGMAENFDALTGKGLRDRAYTWTSSVFMILAHEFSL